MMNDPANVTWTIDKLQQASNTPYNMHVCYTRRTRGISVVAKFKCPEAKFWRPLTGPGHHDKDEIRCGRVAHRATAFT
jgi:hypothetical protein